MIKTIGENVCRYMWQYHTNYAHNFVDCFANEVEVVRNGYYKDDNSIRFVDGCVRVGDMIVVGDVLSHSSENSFMKWSLSMEAKELKNTIHLIALDSPDKLPMIASTSRQAIIFCIAPGDLIQKYFHISSAASVVCGAYFQSMSTIHKISALDSLFVERLQNRCNTILKAHRAGNDNWLNTLLFVIFDSINISSRRNRALFHTLRSTINNYYIIQNLDSLEEIEALLFGAAGLLSTTNCSDEYIYQLRNRYARISRDYSVKSMNGFNWDTRAGMGLSLNLLIAQFAAILHHNRNILNSIVEHQSLESLYKIFDCELSEYWSAHSDFGVECRKGTNLVSRSKVEILLINAILPLLYTYAQLNNIERIDSALLLDYFCALPPEENVFIKRWKSCGVEISNAFETQAILELSKNYCPNRRCYICPMGVRMLKSK